jgi:hypothetical protein
MSGPSKITDVLLTELHYDLFQGVFELKYAFVGKGGDTHGMGRCSTWSPDTEEKFRAFLDSAKGDARKMHGFQEEPNGGEDHEHVPQSQRPHQL